MRALNPHMVLIPLASVMKSVPRHGMEVQKYLNDKQAKHSILQPVMIPTRLSMSDRRQSKARTRPHSPACLMAAPRSVPMPAILFDTASLLGTVHPNMHAWVAIAHSLTPMA
jgi:hypothetical protein